MACLFACFSISKHKRCRLFIKGTSSTDRRRGDERALFQDKKPENQEHAEKPSSTIATPEAKHEDQRVKCNTENKNQFQELPVKAVSDELIKQNGGKADEKSEYHLSKKEDEKSSEKQQQIRVVPESSERKGKQLVHESSERKKNQLEPDSNDRSQCCSRTGDSLKDLALDGFEEADGSDEEKRRNFVIEESSESLFSLSIDSRKRVCEVDCGGEREVTSPIKKENVSRMVEAKFTEEGNKNAQDQGVEFLLNPIKNVIARETIKVNEEKFQEDQEKENLVVELETRCQLLMPELSSKKKLADKEIAVDASLSSWIVESEGTNSVANSDLKGRSSPSGKKGRRVLGEWNLQEPKPEFVCFSKSSTRDQNSDDVSSIGTIGSYLSCTNQTRNRVITI